MILPPPVYDQFGTSDTGGDADICVPFGNVSDAVDWLDSPSKPPTVAIATRVPTVSSATGPSSAFDMASLKLEVSSG